MVRRCVQGFDPAGLGLVNVKMQPHRILQSTDEAQLRIGLLASGHDPILSNAQEQDDVIDVGARVARLQEVAQGIEVHI